MLRHLQIRNFVLIEELDLDLQDGFTVITGETGAGKSILLGAIGLLVGQRADSKSILEGAEKCTVEAIFDTEKYGLETFFHENDFDYDGKECVVRRELTSSGKSRAYINDSPANLNQLRDLGHHLLDIHSQHQNLLLSDEDFQLNVIDTMSETSRELEAYKQAFLQYRQAKKELEEARTEAEQNKRDEDYLRFQLEQLQEFDPREGEDAELEEEQNALSHAEDIKTALYQVAQGLSGDEQAGALDTTRAVKQVLQSLTRIFPKAQELAERMDSIYVEMKDICEEVTQQAERMDYNPQRLEQVNERLDKLYTLEQKHGVNNAAALCVIQKQMESRLQDIDHADEHIAELEAAVQHSLTIATAKAEALTKKRTSVIPAIEKRITSTLTLLGIPAAKFCIRAEQLPNLSDSGCDRIIFLFAANKNATPSPIAQVASGGEISRLMLSLKAMTSEHTQLPTVIFDEIDTGVSGRIAESMALIMKDMSRCKGRQVMTITHLPQIAAQGTHHLRVYKEDSDTRTITRIVPLAPDERTEELAHLLSGNAVTEAAIENARQLLGLD